MPLPKEPDRVIHLVRPADTDPGIDVFLKDHYATFYKSVRKNGRLLVFFPGTAAAPASYRRFMDEAALKGYRVLGLEYPNSTHDRETSAGAAFCLESSDRDCAAKVRRERLFGEHWLAGIGVDHANSAVNRIAKCLSFLRARFPEEGWGDYLNGDEIRWDRLALAGHSQGAGMAAYLAKKRSVGRVIMLSGPGDSFSGEPAPWIGAPGVTPAARLYGAVHRREPGHARIAESFRLLGMDAGRIFTVDVEAAAVPPFSNAEHDSVACDGATPLREDGRPRLVPVWDALLGYRSGIMRR